MIGNNIMSGTVMRKENGMNIVAMIKVVHDATTMSNLSAPSPIASRNPMFVHLFEYWKKTHPGNI